MHFAAHCESPSDEAGRLYEWLDPLRARFGFIASHDDRFFDWTGSDFFSDAAGDEGLAEEFVVVDFRTAFFGVDEAFTSECERAIDCRLARSFSTIRARCGALFSSVADCSGAFARLVMLTRGDLLRRGAGVELRSADEERVVGRFMRVFRGRRCVARSE